MTVRPGSEPQSSFKKFLRLFVPILKEYFAVRAELPSPSMKIMQQIPLITRLFPTPSACMELYTVNLTLVYS